ncbi:META domain-containing protein [Streptomyces tropicalis]|uniref:META domain-containing protein n=1 Tax=Streptomyces tropicalis TaxID=3034234 RepID=A0ABT6ACB7_9ACTN|nr:META domain-containing protein [Streptomyces tropicalis]MDF3302289.1 META domain-containing protein [Streptomyces tropicalis]
MDTQRLTLAVLAVLPLTLACGSGVAGGAAGVGDGSAAPVPAAAPAGAHHRAADATAEADVPLQGTRWDVTATGAGGTAVPVPGKARAHLVFDAGRVTGSLGCNGFSAAATVRDGRIALGPAATTRMMCDASLMTVEKDLLRLFGTTVSYRIDQRTLTLTSENGGTVTAGAAR